MQLWRSLHWDHLHNESDCMCHRRKSQAAGKVATWGGILTHLSDRKRAGAKRIWKKRQKGRKVIRCINKDVSKSPFGDLGGALWMHNQNTFVYIYLWQEICSGYTAMLLLIIQPRPEALIIFNQSKVYLVPKWEHWRHSRVTKLTLGYTPLIFLICNTLGMTFRPAGAWRDLFQLLSCTVSQHASFWGRVHHDRLWFASISSAWTFIWLLECCFAAPEINEPVREALPEVEPRGSNALTRLQARPLAGPFRTLPWRNTHSKA